MWGIDWSDKAIKEFSKIDKAQQQEIVDAIEECAEDPFRFTKRLKGAPLNSLRVGNYRVIVQLVRRRLLVYVVSVGYRSNVYKWQS